MLRTLEGKWLWIEIQMYDNCLREDPRKSTRSQLNEITPAKPYWLNDYYVATALESLSKEGRVVKAKRYLNFWPPNSETFNFRIVDADKSASEEAARIETDDICLAYQSIRRCPRQSRFERQDFAKTVSPRETRFETIFPKKDMAPPCELCWEKEDRERDIRILVENITEYDFTDIATLEITGANREFKDAVLDACIESQYEADVDLIKPVVRQAIDIRQKQIALGNPRLEYEWRKDEQEQFRATLKEYIKSQSVG